MTRNVKVATTQMQISRDAAANLVRGSCCGWKWRGLLLWMEVAGTGGQGRSDTVLLNWQDKAEKMVRDAAAAGANVILLQVRCTLLGPYQLQQAGCTHVSSREPAISRSSAEPSSSM
jgi:hypothetical protein